MVDIDPLEVEDTDFLKSTITRHHELTGSTVAADILERWQFEVRKFQKVMPTDYKRVLEAARIAEEKGLSVDEAIMAAAHG
jgi:glutamate synthase (NADPH/NADH) large chain